MGYGLLDMDFVECECLFVSEDKCVRMLELVGVIVDLLFLLLCSIDTTFETLKAVFNVCNKHKLLIS